MDVKKKYVIFVVEDNKLYNQLVTDHLAKKGFTNVKSFLTGKECIEAIKNNVIPDIVVQDYFMSEMDGLEVLQQVKKLNSGTEFIFLTGNEDVEVAVNTIKSGAYDYVIKDKVALDKVVNKIQKIIKVAELERKNKQIQALIKIFTIVIIIVALCSVLVFGFDIFNLF